jgi:hypothetical protein
MRREDLVQAASTPRLERELGELNRPLAAACTRLARRLFGGRPSHRAIEATVCAVSDIPIGAIRRHLVAGSDFPRDLRSQIEAAARAALVAAGANEVR